MAKVYALDPGKAGGLAVFLGGELMACYTGSPQRLRDIVRAGEGGRGTDLVIERPQIYQRGKSKGDPNKLLDLYGQGRELAGILGLRAVEYAPAEWKGQVPKEVHHDRIPQHLDAEERQIWELQNKDGKDAIALGLFHLGRVGRGGSKKGSES